MRTGRTHRHRTFSPLQDKTVANVLRQLFVTEFGYENKVLFAEAMIERILQTLDAFMKPASLLRPGQLLWTAVVHDGRKHAFKPMKDIPQEPVILDLVTNDDLRDLADGEAFPVVRRRRHTRILKQAFAQGGVLAQTDLAAISLIHESHVGKDIAHVQKDEHCLLPYRGSVQDVGPTLTHKVEVARLLEAGYLEPEIARMLSPVHNLRSVEHYAQIYKNVLKLLEGGFAPSEISGILSISERMVDAYLDIVKEHHPEILATNPHLRDRPDTR